MSTDEIALLREISVKLDLLVGVSLVANRKSILDLLATELDSQEKRQVFEFLDGSHSVRDIAEKTGVNISSISRWSQRWEKIGLITAGDILGSGRRRHLFDLSAYLLEK